MTRILVVDAFADGPFTGNPAAVVLLDEPRPPSWMQRVAAEMNLSETAFVLPADRREWTLRWFTPTVEVRLCGHATLASAHTLWSQGIATGEVVFTTLGGRLTASQDGDLVSIDLSTRPVVPIDPPAGLAAVLGATPHRFVGRTSENDERDADWLVELADAETVRAATPDLPRLATLPIGGLIITAPAALPGVDFVSRYFAPGQGIDEDPVTGSAHCALAPYWSARTGRADQRAVQLSARTGALRVVLRGGRTQLIGRAVTVLTGELTV